MLERWRGLSSAWLDPGNSGPIWLVPLEGVTLVGGEKLEPGTVWMAEGASTIAQDPEGRLIVAYCGNAVRPGLLGREPRPRPVGSPAPSGPGSYG